MFVFGGFSGKPQGKPPFWGGSGLQKDEPLCLCWLDTSARNGPPPSPGLGRGKPKARDAAGGVGARRGDHAVPGDPAEVPLVRGGTIPGDYGRGSSLFEGTHFLLWMVLKEYQEDL